jgi:adenosylcobinamide-GDP ribazoletransferase
MKRLLKQLVFAYGFLTVIPGLGRITIAPEDTGRSTVFYPLVGLTIGLFYYPIWLLRALSPLSISVLLCVFTLAFTRALHADGLVDTFDGFLSGRREPEEILAVMRDSRQGALGFISAFCVYLLKIAFFYELLRSQPESFPFVLAVVPALSRGGVPLAGCLFSYAGGDKGLGKSFVDSIRLPQAALSILLMLIISFSRIDPFRLLAVPLVCFFWVIWGCICRLKIAGLTGDTLGAGIELSEVVALVVFYGLSIR